MVLACPADVAIAGEGARRPSIVCIPADDLGHADAACLPVQRGFDRFAGALLARIVALATEMAPPQLLMEAIRLTFYAPPVSGDPSVLFNQGD